MFKPKKYNGTKSTFALVNEFREQGKFISIPFGEYGESEPEKKWAIRSKFQPYNFVANNEESIEETIYWLNENVDYGKWEFVEPRNSEDDYLVEVLEGAHIYFLVVDEYYGRGESETYVMLQGIVLEREVTEEEVDYLLNWTKEMFGIE